VSVVEQKSELDPWRATSDQSKFLDGIYANCAKEMAAFWFSLRDEFGRPNHSQTTGRKFGSTNCDVFILDCSVPGKLLAVDIGDGAKELLGEIRENDDLVKIMQRRGKARSLCFANEVAETGCVIHEIHHRQTAFEQDFIVERLMFPLFDGDGRVTEIFGMVTGCDGNREDFAMSSEVETEVITFDPMWDNR